MAFRLGHVAYSVVLASTIPANGGNMSAMGCSVMLTWRLP